MVEYFLHCTYYIAERVSFPFSVRRTINNWYQLVARCAWVVSVIKISRMMYLDKHEIDGIICDRYNLNLIFFLYMNFRSIYLLV